MLFNSCHFLIFFPVVTFLYFSLPHRARWILLLGASMYFYIAFIPSYIIILAVIAAVDYTAGLLIEQADGRKRKALFISAVVASLLPLAVFKYFNLGMETPWCWPSAEMIAGDI